MAIEGQEEQDITLDVIGNTGVGADRTPIPSEEPATEPKPADTPPSSDKGSDDKTDEEKLQNLFSSFSNEDTIPEDKKEIRERLLTKYEGKSFDANGNVLNEEGEIVKPFKDILEELDKEETTKDDKGNIIDEEGNVVKTAFEVAAEETVVNKLHADSDFIFEDEEGNPRIYSDDAAGIQEFAEDLAQARFEEMRKEELSSNPVLHDIALHLETGGDINSYKEPVDYNNIDITKLSEEDKVYLIRESLEVKNVAKPQVDAILQAYKDGNLLDSQVALALPALAEHQEDERQHKLQIKQEQEEANEKAAEEYWGSMQTIVDKGALSESISIPDEDKEDFFSYISDAVDAKGNSKEALDAQKETKEQKLMISYLRFKGLDVSALVKSGVRNQKVKSLKELIEKSANISNTALLNDASKASLTSEEDITINSLLS